MKKVILVLLVLVVIATGPTVCFAQSARLSEQIGKYVNHKLIKGGVSFKLTNATVNISAYNATTVRIRASKESLDNDFSFAIDNLTPSATLTVASDKQNQWELKTDSLLIQVKGNPFRVNIYNLQHQLLCGDDEGLGISWFGNQVSCYKKLHSDEKFIGLGEKTGNINRRGSFYQNWNSDNPGYGNNSDPLYATIPFFVGIHDKLTYGIFFDNCFKSYFNFGGGADEELFHFGADDGEMNYYFFGGSTVASIIKDYTTLTGRTPMPPMWSLGFQQSRWGYDNQGQLLTIAKTFREKRMPADVIVSDINYMDNYKVFTWSNKYPDTKGMLDTMKQMGFDMVTIVDPGIKVEKGYAAYESGLAGNHFAKYPDGKTYVGHVWPGRCHFPDFTKKTTADWWGNNFKDAYVQKGVRGFWNDMNEPAAWGREFPNLIEFGDGANKKTLYQVKNAYGLLMAKATYEGTKANMNGQRPFVLTRASYSGVQKYSAQWTGDNVSTDENMMLGFRLLGSMGLSGIPYTGMDIGGFMGNPSPELFIRWMSLAVYSPLFRNHTHIGYNYREPWLFGEFNTDKIRKILEQRYQLLPYLYSSFYTAHNTGMPINRMLPIDYTNDNKVYEEAFQTQYLFGDNMLVCPVISSKEVANVYLPGSAKWYRLSDNTPYDGGNSYWVNSPIDNPPVFVKAGAIIPMQSTIQNTKEKGDGILYLNIWKGTEASSFMYYEDDGETYQYEQGSFYKRNIIYDASSSSLMLQKKEGSFSSKFNKLRIVLHGFDNKTVKDYELKDEAMIIKW